MKKIFLCFVLCFCLIKLNSSFANDFVEAAGAGNLQLVNNYGGNINVQNEFGYTALMKAAYGGHTKVVEALLKKNAHVNAKTTHGYTALMLASASGHVQITRLLLQKKADITLTDNKGLTAHAYATQAKKSEIIKLLDDAKIEAYLQAARNGNLQKVKQFFNEGMGVNVAKYGYSPLMAAAEKGHIDIVRFLLSKGAKVNHANHEGSALNRAAVDGHLQIADLLLIRGATVDVNDQWGNTALSHAASGGHTKLVKLLTEKGADINHRAFRHGYTPLANAAANGHIETVKYLLSKGAKKDIKTEDKKTALMLAREYGHSGVVNVLMGNADGIIFDDINSAPKPSNTNNTDNGNNKDLQNIFDELSGSKPKGDGEPFQDINTDTRKTVVDAPKPKPEPKQSKPFPDYGLYHSLVNVYLHEFGSLQSKPIKNFSMGNNVWGLMHLKLDDLNNDGVKELILVRTYKNFKSSGEYEQLGLDNTKQRSVQIFTITKNKGLTHVGSLMHGDAIGDWPGWPQIHYATVNGKKYIINGESGGDAHVETWWRMQGVKMVTVMKFDGDPIFGNAKLNGKKINQATFDRWYKKVKTLTLSNSGANDVATLKKGNASVIQLLKKYPPTQGDFASAFFSNTLNYVFENTPNTEAENEVARHLKLSALHSLNNTDNYKNKMSNFFIYDFLTYTPNNLKRVSSRLAKSTAKDAKDLGVYEYRVVCTVVNAKINRKNPEHIWFLVGKRHAEDRWNTLKVYQ